MKFRDWWSQGKNYIVLEISSIGLETIVAVEEVREFGFQSRDLRASGVDQLVNPVIIDSQVLKVAINRVEFIFKAINVVFEVLDGFGVDLVSILKVSFIKSLNRRFSASVMRDVE